MVLRVCLICVSVLRSSYALALNHAALSWGPQRMTFIEHLKLTRKWREYGLRYVFTTTTYIKILSRFEEKKQQICALSYATRAYAESNCREHIDLGWSVLTVLCRCTTQKRKKTEEQSFTTLMWHNAHKGTFNGNGMSRQPSTQFYLFRKSKSHANEQWTLYVTCFQPNSELQLQGMTIWTSWAAVRELIQHLWIDRQARRMWIFFFASIASSAIKHKAPCRGP